MSCIVFLTWISCIHDMGANQVECHSERMQALTDWNLAQCWSSHKLSEDTYTCVTELLRGMQLACCGRKLVWKQYALREVHMLRIRKRIGMATPRAYHALPVHPGTEGTVHGWWIKHQKRQVTWLVNSGNRIFTHVWLECSHSSPGHCLSWCWYWGFKFGYCYVVIEECSWNPSPLRWLGQSHVALL